jgi:hypothetical protein
MPKLTYTPEGREDDPYVFEFEWGDLMSPECVAIEKLTGLDYYEDVPPKFYGGNVETIHAILYVLMKRSIPTMKPESLQFRGREIERAFSVAEARAAVDAIHEESGTDPDGWSREEALVMRTMEETLKDELPPQPERGDDPKD